MLKKLSGHAEPKYFYVHIGNPLRIQGEMRELRKNLGTSISSGFTASIMIALIIVSTGATIPAYALQPVTLTLIGGTGTMTKNATDILAMPSTSGLGGTKSASGSISNYGTYQGVSVLYLCNLVGGIQNGSTIRTVDVTGNYTVDFTYAQVQNGTGFNTYNTSGTAVSATQPLTLMLAYSYNGSELSSSNGPLRAVIVGSEGLVTDGSFWNKQVAKIQIIPPAIPEFTPNTAIILIACFVGLTMLVAFKKGLSVSHASTHSRAKKYHV